MKVLAPLILSFILVSGCIYGVPPVIEHELQPGEIINNTYDIPPDLRYGQLPRIEVPSKNKAFCIFASTTTRGSPAAEISFEYTYNTTSTTTDKFGTYSTTTTRSRCFDIGTTDDNSNVDRIIANPENAIHSYVILRNTAESDRLNFKTAPHTQVAVSISPCEIPQTPLPPPKGTVVNCSDYHKIETELYYLTTWSSDGRTWLNLPGDPAPSGFRTGGYYITYSNKFGVWTYPAELEVISETSCRVL